MLEATSTSAGVERLTRGAYARGAPAQGPRGERSTSPPNGLPRGEKRAVTTEPFGLSPTGSWHCVAGMWGREKNGRREGTLRPLRGGVVPGHGAWDPHRWAIGSGPGLAGVGGPGYPCAVARGVPGRRNTGRWASSFDSAEVSSKLWPAGRAPGRTPMSQCGVGTGEDALALDGVPRVVEVGRQVEALLDAFEPIGGRPRLGVGRNEQRATVVEG